MESNPRFNEEDYKARVLAMTGLDRTISDEEISQNIGLQRKIDENREYRLSLFEKGNIKEYNRELRKLGLPEYVPGEKRYDNPRALLRGFGALGVAGAMYYLGRDYLLQPDVVPLIDGNIKDFLGYAILPAVVGGFGLYNVLRWAIDKEHYHRVNEICQNLPKRSSK